MTARQHTVVATILAILGLYVMRLTSVEIQPSPEGLIAIDASAVVQHGIAHVHSAPLVPWASALGIFAFGHAPLAMRWFAILSGLVVCCTTYLLARRIVTFNSAVLAMVLVGTSLPLITFGRQATSEMPFLAFALLALWASTRFPSSTTFRDTLLSMVLYAGGLAGALLCSPVPAMIVAVFGLVMVKVSKRRGLALTALAIGLVSAVPWLLLLPYDVARDFALMDNGFARRGPLSILLMVAEASPLLVASLFWLVLALLKRGHRPDSSEHVTWILAGWLILGLLVQIVDPYRSALTILYVVPPSAILALFAVESIKKMQRPGVLLGLYGAVIIASMWFVLSSVLHVTLSRYHLVLGMLGVVGLSTFAFISMRSTKRRMTAAIYLYTPVLYGAVGLAIVASLLVVLRGNPTAIAGGRAVAAALDEDTLAVRSFVYLYHDGSSADALNGQLDWYSRGWMTGGRDRYRYVPVEMPKQLIDEPLVEALRGASWIVYYHPSIATVEQVRVRTILGSQYSMHVESPMYTLYRNR
ncbi:MAG: glycosyltransferase family 39 protein [Candidatus Kapabacteria bacterium]|nr:glycosyltransferase family 39 protein [Candidatus Kapabacteria bacterium]